MTKHVHNLVVRCLNNGQHPEESIHGSQGNHYKGLEQLMLDCFEIGLPIEMEEILSMLDLFCITLREHGTNQELTKKVISKYITKKQNLTFINEQKRKEYLKIANEDTEIKQIENGDENILEPLDSSNLNEARLNILWAIDELANIDAKLKEIKVA